MHPSVQSDGHGTTREWLYVKSVRSLSTCQCAGNVGSTFLLCIEHQIGRNQRIIDGLKLFRRAVIMKLLENKRSETVKAEKRDDAVGTEGQEINSL